MWCTPKKILGGLPAWFYEPSWLHNATVNTVIQEIYKNENMPEKYKARLALLQLTTDINLCLVQKPTFPILTDTTTTCKESSIKYTCS